MDSSGIIHRSTSGYLMLRALLNDAAGAIISTGTATLRIAEILQDGSLASLDFDDGTFKTSGWTTASVSMTHRQAYSGVNTGLWTHRILASSITRHADTTGVLIVMVDHSSAYPVRQAQEIMFGGADGDLQVSDDGYLKVEVSSLGDASKPWNVYTSSAYDHETSTAKFEVHAESNGEQVLIKNASIVLKDSTNTTIGTVSGIQDNAGKKFFPLEISALTLLPDSIYYVETTVLKMDDTTKVSGTTSVTFD